MTGLGTIAGIHRVELVDEGTIAVSGELDKKCVVAIKDLKGETLSVINMGSEQVRIILYVCALWPKSSHDSLVTRRHIAQLLFDAHLILVERSSFSNSES